MNNLAIFCLVTLTQALNDEGNHSITTLPDAPEFRITDEKKVEMIIKPVRQDNEKDFAKEMTLHLPGEEEKDHKPGDPYIILTNLEACKKQENLYITYRHFSVTRQRWIKWRVNNISYTPNVQGCSKPPVDTKAILDTKAPADTWSSLTSPPAELLKHTNTQMHCRAKFSRICAKF